MKGFYHIWVWQPSLSCDPDAANKLSFPLSKEAPHMIGQTVSEEKIFENVNGRQTDAGSWVHQGNFSV